MSDPAVCFRLRDVSKSYVRGHRPALAIDALDLYRGEITAILGYSAAGKSTLLNLLGLLDAHDPRGDGAGIRFEDGDPYHRLSARARNRLRRDRFGFIFQSHHLASHLSAQANVAVPLGLLGHGRRARLAKARALLASAGIEDRSRWAALPSTLSGGESLRVAVLRALAHEPDVLFADEPTGSLDPHTGAKVMDLIVQWSREQPGRTVLLVTHNFHEAFHVADRFVIMQYGRVVFDGRKHEDVASPEALLSQMDGSQRAPHLAPAQGTPTPT